MSAIVIRFVFLGTFLAFANELCTKGADPSGTCFDSNGDATAMLQGVRKLSTLGARASEKDLHIENAQSSEQPVSGAGQCIDMCGSFADDMGWDAVCSQAGDKCSACKGCGGTLIVRTISKVRADEQPVSGAGQCVDMCASFAADMGWPATCKQAGPMCSACTDCGGSFIAKSSAEALASEQPVSGAGQCVDMCASFAADMGWPATCKQAGPMCSACTDCGGSLIAKSSAEALASEQPVSGGGQCVDMCASFAADMGWPKTCKEAGPMCWACTECGGSLIAKSNATAPASE
jgi:hypothetical protein